VEKHQEWHHWWDHCCLATIAFILDIYLWWHVLWWFNHNYVEQCSSTGLPRNPSVPQKMWWGSLCFKGSVRVPRFLGKWFLASVRWRVTLKFFISPCCIQTPSRPVSYTGGWVQIVEKEILGVVVSLVVH